MSESHSMFFFDLPLLEQIAILYFVAANVVTFFYFGLDKLQARLGHQRTPETLLWFLALLGGTIGALAGMHFFRHKTQKVSFQLVLVLILIVQMLACYALFFR